ncbi:hypothetical protein F5888DRAFT_606771 [Russula emetica]|nr:hypothetical protein F5888DRAFT_606771 [Russula emetica]
MGLSLSLPSSLVSVAWFPFLPFPHTHPFLYAKYAYAYETLTLNKGGFFFSLFRVSVCPFVSPFGFWISFAFFA